MPRIYKRKTNKGLFSPEIMKKALGIVRNGKSIRQAAIECGLSFSTLSRYVKKEKIGTLTKYAPNYKQNRRIFTDEQEDALEQYIINSSKMFYGLSIIECRKLAYEMAIRNNISVNNKWHEAKMAGKEWMLNFRRRHEGLSLRSPEACSLARATSFNKHNVQIFFRNLANVLSRYESFADGTRIFNLDETATTTVQRPQKVLAEKGLKSVSQVTSGEKGVLVTTCAIISASGQYVPPAMVFPRIHFKAHMLKGAPIGTLGLASQSGWMTADLFLQVAKHFVKHTCSSKDNATLLIYDNHESHLSLAVLDYAKENGVTILTLPPHSSNKMQPLDVGVFGPFKAAYNAAVDSWMLCNPGKPYTIYDVAQCVGLAFEKAMTPSNIISAFKKTGIFPINPDVFSDLDFLPSSVTDRVEPIAVEHAGSINEQQQESHIPSNSRFFSPTTSKVHEPVPSTSGGFNPTEPVVSPSAKFLSPEMFRGYPKAGARKRVQKGRKSGRSLIPTDTPEKEDIAKRRCNKENKKPKKVKRRILREFSSDEFDTERNSEIVELDEETIFNFDCNKIPEEGNYLLVKFAGKRNNIFYVGKAIGELNEDRNIDVSFLRKSGSVFVMPDVPDIAQVTVEDIKWVLPPPTVLGTTQRQQTQYKFSIAFSGLNVC